MLIISAYTLYNTKHFIDKLDYMFVNNKQLSYISESIDKIDSELLNYLTTKNSDSLDEYIIDSQNIKSYVGNINVPNSFKQSDLMLGDIVIMVNEYIVETDNAIRAKRGRNVPKYTQRYNNSKQITEYINYYINKLNSNQFEENTNKYFYISTKLKILEILNIIIIGVTFLLNILIILWFTEKISTPVVSLAHAAEKISQGDFEVDDVKVISNDETKIMAETFNKMKNNIKEYIEELHNQADIKDKLMDEKMQNLKMKNLLKNAQLKALQSQINPHFLFNTLNAGVQIAMMEDAEKTGAFLEKMSDLFRYNLKKMDNPVSLQEEIENSKTYAYLLETRFGSSIKFIFQIDKEALNIKMPLLILQPIIENACIHGLGDSENGLTIKLTAKHHKDNVVVIIEDNGVGIDKKTINKIYENSKELNNPKHKIGHTTGIGLNNVIFRLKIYFEKEDVFSIESQFGKGTKVMLTMPNELYRGELSCTNYL